MRSPALRDSLVVFLCGITAVAICGGSYIADYLGGGWPLGWDASGHFVVSQRYADTLWPSLTGALESFFQGVRFPQFYPPLFYLLCGGLYQTFTATDRALLFKLLVLAGVVFIPSLVGLLSRALGMRLWLACLTAVTAGILFCSSIDQTIGLYGATTLGFVSQGFGASLLLLLLITLTIATGRYSQTSISAALAALFLLSNYHLILVGSVLLLVFALLLRRTGAPLSSWGISGLALGALLTLPWCLRAFLDRASSPAVPDQQLLATVFDSYSLLGVVLSAALVPAIADAAHARLAAFCTAIAAVFPLLLFDPTALGLTVPWQAPRMAAALLLLLPIPIFAVAQILLDRPSPKSLGGQSSVVLYALIAVVAPCALFVPLERRLSTLSNAQSNAMQRLITFLVEHPSPGYYVTLYSHDGPAASLADAALSHYPALSGARGMWSILRESSFNAVFVTALRNISSSSFESWGIGSRLTPEAYADIPLANRIAALSRWGVDRIIFRSTNRDQFQTNSAPGDIGAPFTVEYQDSYYTVGRLTTPPVLETKFHEAVLLIGPPLALHSNSKAPDFSALAEHLALSAADFPVILQFQSCTELYAKLPAAAGAPVACLQPEHCCTTQIDSFEQLKAPALRTPVEGTVYNSSALTWSGLVAAPFRRVALSPAPPSATN